MATRPKLFTLTLYKERLPALELNFYPVFLQRRWVIWRVKGCETLRRKGRKGTRKRETRSSDWANYRTLPPFLRKETLHKGRECI